MIKPFIQTSDPRCITCNSKMRFSCKEIEASGFVHDVFECPKCRSTQSYVTPEQAPQLARERRVAGERRSGIDTRSESEKQLAGERRSQIVRRSDQNKTAGQQPSTDQLSIFAKRVKRAMRDEKSRHFFGVASGENDFKVHADVRRVLEWIENLGADAAPN